MSLRAQKITLRKLPVARMEVVLRCHNGGKIEITLYDPANKPFEVIMLTPPPGQTVVPERTIATIVFFYKLREYERMSTLCPDCQKKMEAFAHPVVSAHPLSSLGEHWDPVSCVG